MQSTVNRIFKFFILRSRLSDMRINCTVISGGLLHKYVVVSHLQITELLQSLFENVYILFLLFITTKTQNRARHFAKRRALRLGAVGCISVTKLTKFRCHTEWRSPFQNGPLLSCGWNLVLLQGALRFPPRLRLTPF
jgi:hypothetical protein